MKYLLQELKVKYESEKNNLIETSDRNLDQIITGLNSNFVKIENQIQRHWKYLYFIIN